MITVALCGCSGKMGRTIINAIAHTDDISICCGITVDAEGFRADFPIYTDVAEALADFTPDVFVDFTQPSAIEGTLRKVLPRGIDCVVGTTGLSEDKLAELYELAPEGTCLFYAPNFTTGAVLMMQFAELAAPFFEQSEIIEFHHAAKKDAPSGTSLTTAARMNAARNKAAQQAGEEPLARGLNVDGIHIHSVRSDGYMASQEVIFGSTGQTLTIRHDSWDRQSYMPGVLMGIRNVAGKSGLVIGLDNFMR